MTSKKHQLTETAVLVAAFVAGASSVASADDSSISRFGGDSYAYFNSQPINNSHSMWRQDNPQGLSQRMLQAYSASSASSAWQLETPVFSSIASDSTFKQTHPNGLTERELQALSSPGPAWHPAPAQELAEPRFASQPFTGRLVRSAGPDNAHGTATGE